MDVAEQGEKVPVRVYEKRLVPSLEQVARPMVATVKRLRVGRLQAMEDS
jgi:hypothetical protein